MRRIIRVKSHIQFFGYLLDLLPQLPINLQELLESRDRRVDGWIFGYSKPPATSPVSLSRLLEE